ncbi:MAG: putative epoxidase [Ilumatobacteraceae bacterium]|nr:putative epoxidase [Ilumatobacteraceae bacterium]
MHVAVVGGGVAGLGSALTFARRGHTVTVIERDDTPMPATADDAFEWDRRGAPQVRHSHAFLARLTGILRRDHPDVYADLLAEGATELRFGDDLPPSITNFEREPGDDELVMLACRRTTFEWVVRRAAMAEGRVTFRTGVGVDGLTVDTVDTGGSPAGRVDGRPHVNGVHLADGSTLAADLVIVAGGRRTALPDWLLALDVPSVVEEAEDTGIVYLSRFFRLRDGAEYPPRAGAIGGDLGYLKYGVFVGDNRTFSVTLATPTDDTELRRTLAEPSVFDACARQLTVAAPWLDGRAQPITSEVHVMAGLLNRWRDLVVDGEPVVTGAIAIGDSVLCTNPLYGRGCSTAFWGARLAADAADAHPDDPRGLALAYDQALRAEILPWYRATVHQDGEARRVAAKLLAGEDPDGDPDDPSAFMRGVLRDGLAPALRSDAVVLRAFLRSFNLLTAPDAMLADPDVQARVLQVWQDRDNRPPEPSLGPRTRTDLLAALHA